jgi:hypothetical protein
MRMTASVKVPVRLLTSDGVEWERKTGLQDSGMLREGRAGRFSPRYHFFVAFYDLWNTLCSAPIANVISAVMLLEEGRSRAYPIT